MGENCRDGLYWDPLIQFCVNCKFACKQQQVIDTCVSYCVPTALKDSTALFYSLLVLCMVLLFLSLSLTLAVLLRGFRSRASNPRAKKVTRRQERVIRLGEEVGQPVGPLRQSTKDYVSNSRSDDSSPTETCVCVHCFPELKPLHQGDERLLRAPVFPRAHIQNGGPHWTDKSPHFSGLELREEAARR